MSDEKRVKDIMIPIEEYRKIDQGAPLRQALGLLKKGHEDMKAGKAGLFHRTLFVTDAKNRIVGKLSMYDVVKGLVPEMARKPEMSRALYSVLSSRALEVADEVRDFQDRFKWLHHGFKDLVRQESGKKVGDIMSPVHPVLKEEDSINQAIYAIFKENIRQPLVARDGEITGVVDSIHIFDELMEISGPDIGVNW
ncbi:MAG: CBS domain-containing protein [Desulfatiglandaceae bacterium]|jgi:Mg/Co/Ni transporter MgtE